MQQIAMFDNQRLSFSVSPVDAQGNSATIQAGSLAVTFDNTTASATINADGQSGFIHVPKGAAAGQFTATISADADPGDGVQTISTAIQIEIQHRLAATLNATFGTPEDEPAA